MQSNKYCLIHAIQSGGTLIRGGAYSDFGLLEEHLFERGAYSREGANSNKYGINN